MEIRAEEALNEVCDEVIRIFQTKYLLKYAYIRNPKQYQRTNEFFQAWDWTKARKTLKEISRELWYDSSKLKTFDVDSYIHGSIYSSPEDAREDLADILNVKGYTSSLWLSVYRQEAYWTKFLEDMLDQRELEKIVTRIFLAKGFTKI